MEDTAIEHIKSIAELEDPLEEEKDSPQSDSSVDAHISKKQRFTAPTDSIFAPFWNNAASCIFNMS